MSSMCLVYTVSFHSLAEEVQNYDFLCFLQARCDMLEAQTGEQEEKVKELTKELRNKTRTVQVSCETQYLKI